MRILLFSFLFITSAWAGNKPENLSSTDKEIDLNGFYTIKRNHKIYSQINIIDQEEQFTQTNVHLSYRYRINSNWRLGVSLERLTGLRHN